MSIHTSLVFIDPGPGQGSKGSSNKLLSVTCAGRGKRPAFHLLLDIWALIIWYSGLYPPLTVTDTRSIAIVPVAVLETYTIDQASAPLIIRYLKGSISKGLTIWGDDYDDTPNLIIYLNITK